MADYGVVPSGFVKKPLPTIVDEVSADIKAALGTQQVRLDSYSLIGKLMGVFSASVSSLWDLAESVYANAYPGGASGVSLQGCLDMVGLKLKPATRSTVLLACYGTSGTTIPALSRVSTTDNGDTFETVDAITLSNLSCARARARITASVVEGTAYAVIVNGRSYSYTAVSGDDDADVFNALVSLINSYDDAVSAVVSSAPGIAHVLSVVGVTDPMDSTRNLMLSFEAVSPVLLLDVIGYADARAVRAGPVRAVVGALTRIESPIAGWDAANNLVAATLGQDIETDWEARSRRNESLSAIGADTVDSLRARLLDVSGVTFAQVYQNRTDTTDGNGLAAHSIEVIILGGDNTEIAQTLWDYAGAGVGFRGVTTAQATDSEGNAQAVNFARPTEVPMWMRITYSLDSENALFPVGGAALITSAAVASMDSLAPGNNVFPSRIESAIFNAVPGLSSVDVEVALDSSGSPGAYQYIPYSIARSSIATFSSLRTTLVLV